MNIWERLRPRQQKRAAGGQTIWVMPTDDICVPGYTSLDKNPDILTACRKIATLLGAATIHLMANTADGDKRINNELSRLIDINPMPTMTRSAWMEYIVMTMLLYGKGNAIVQPHTYGGYIHSLEPIAPDRVRIEGISRRSYRVYIDSTQRDPASLLHFVHNPDKDHPYKGAGINVALKDVAQNLKQAAATQNAFLSSEYKPSIIVKVDALTDEFASPQGRQKLIESYLRPAVPGQPWVIPAEQMAVEQVKPLTLGDLAIKDTVELDKRTVASIVGVPPYVLGVGSYHRDEWNAFIQSTIMPMAKNIAQELTKKLIIKDEWYLRFNVWSLMDYELDKVSAILLSGADRGFINGDEWRDRMHMPPAGLKEYNVLENYIPIDMTGSQKKLEGNR